MCDTVVLPHASATLVQKKCQDVVGPVDHNDQNMLKGTFTNQGKAPVCKRSHSENHTSAVYPKDVEAYLSEESDYGAILGPFKVPPLENLHISPFMTRDKPNAPPQ